MEILIYGNSKRKCKENIYFVVVLFLAADYFRTFSEALNDRMKQVIVE